MGQRSKASKLLIGALARHVGMSRDAVRYYEQLGLVQKPARASNGYRVYSTTDVGRLLFIRRAKLLGFSLEEVRELVGLADQGECQPVRHQVAEMLRQKLAECEATLAELRAFRANLEECYEVALERQDTSGSICAAYPTSCDCLPVAVHELDAARALPKRSHG
jgi:MerR family transcriptional regulator, copper efflux regulator